jgi:ERCC4-related helicase
VYHTFSGKLLCRKFVGQVAGKKGAGGDSAGMSQKDQKAVIQDFRKGLFNVLVCADVQ